MINFITWRRKGISPHTDRQTHTHTQHDHIEQLCDREDVFRYLVQGCSRVEPLIPFTYAIRPGVNIPENPVIIEAVCCSPVYINVKYVT